MVPPLPTYNIAGVQVVILSAGRRLGFSTVAGPGVTASVQIVKSPRKCRLTKGTMSLANLVHNAGGNLV